jgi:hypothetical protein
VEVALLGGPVIEIDYVDFAVVVVLAFFAGLAVGRLRGLVADGRR